MAITLNSYSWQTTILTFENHFGGSNLLIRLSLLSAKAFPERGDYCVEASSFPCSSGSLSVC